MTRNAATISENIKKQCFEALENLQNYIRSKNYKTAKLTYNYLENLEKDNGKFLIVFGFVGIEKRYILNYSPCTQSQEAYLKELKACCFDIFTDLENI